MDLATVVIFKVFFKTTTLSTIKRILNSNKGGLCCATIWDGGYGCVEQPPFCWGAMMFGLRCEQALALNCSLCKKHSSEHLIRLGFHFGAKCSPCPETRAITSVRVQTRAKSPARAKNNTCQHHYQPCNRTCQIGTLLSQLQHRSPSQFPFITLHYSALF